MKRRSRKNSKKISKKVSCVPTYGKRKYKGKNNFIAKAFLGNKEYVHVFPFNPKTMKGTLANHPITKGYKLGSKVKLRFSKKQCRFIASKV